MRDRPLKNKPPVLIWLATWLLLTGCGLQWPGAPNQTAPPDFFEFGEELARQLDQNLRQPLNQESRVIVAAFVSLDELYESSRFGRSLAEALSNSLFRRGYGVVEVRQAAELLIKKPAGELILTRDAALLATSHQAAAIVAGLYALTPDSVLVTVRVLDPASQDIWSVADLEIVRTPNINAMLFGSRAGGAALSAYER